MDSNNDGLLLETLIAFYMRRTKKNGRKLHFAKIQKFKDCIMDCGLMDLGFRNMIRFYYLCR